MVPPVSFRADVVGRATDVWVMRFAIVSGSIITTRKLMIEAGIWWDRVACRPRPYPPRYRRDCRGELIQIDGSKHWWFEDRGPQCTLLVYIDDATSEMMHLKMVESESTFAFLRNRTHPVIDAP